MTPSRTLLKLVFLASLPILSSCTLIRVRSHDHPPSLQASGLIEGHLAFGMNAETRIVDLDLFDGRSSGAIAELVVWKLFRLEVGIAGVAVGVGPVDVGLGVLAYEPRMPDYPSSREQDIEEMEDDAGQDASDED